MSNIASLHISENRYSAFINQANEVSDGKFAAIHGMMIEVVFCDYDDVYRAFVVSYKTPDGYYGPDHKFKYESENFVECRMWETDSEDNGIQIGIEQEAIKYFLQKVTTLLDR
jgi:hypothetical protein